MSLSKPRKLQSFLKLAAMSDCEEDSTRLVAVLIIQFGNIMQFCMKTKSLSSMEFSIGSVSLRKGRKTE